MKHLLFLLIIFTLFPREKTYAQKPVSRLGKQGQARIDSLLQELPKAKDDTNKVNILDKLSSEYRNINPDDGIKYGQQGLALAAKLGWEKGTGWAYNNLANNYQHKSDYPKAFEYFFKP